MPLYAILKDLAFRNLSLEPNKIDFVLSCPKCILNLLSTNQSHKLEKSLISCFCVGILNKYHEHKVKSHLCKVKTRVDLK